MKMLNVEMCLEHNMSREDHRLWTSCPYGEVSDLYTNAHCITYGDCILCSPETGDNHENSNHQSLL